MTLDVEEVFGILAFGGRLMEDAEEAEAGAGRYSAAACNMPGDTT